MVIKEFGEIVEKLSDAIALLVKSMEHAVASSAKGLHVIVNAHNRRVLKALLKQLMKLRYSQMSLPYCLWAYAKSRDEHYWYRAQARMLLTKEITLEILDLLEKDKSDFIVHAEDAYETILFGMENRLQIYERFSQMPPPRTRRELAVLLLIAHKYAKMIDKLAKAQSVVATYLSDGVDENL